MLNLLTECSSRDFSLKLSFCAKTTKNNKEYCIKQTQILHTNSQKWHDTVVDKRLFIYSVKLRFHHYLIVFAWMEACVHSNKVISNYFLLVTSGQIFSSNKNVSEMLRTINSLTRFILLVSFYIPWKHQKTFSDVLGAYRERPAAWNGLLTNIPYNIETSQFICCACNWLVSTWWLIINVLTGSWNQNFTLVFCTFFLISRKKNILVLQSFDHFPRSFEFGLSDVILLWFGVSDVMLWWFGRCKCCQFMVIREYDFTWLKAPYTYSELHNFVKND